MIEIGQNVVTPTGTFANCVCTETKGSGKSKVKVYAPGVGLVQDGPFALVKIYPTVPEQNKKCGHTEKKF